MHDRFTRRSMLGLLSAVPLSAALTGCDQALDSLDSGARDANAADAAHADSGALDAGTIDAGALDAGAECVATESDALGPFFEEGSPSRAQIAALEEPGDRLFVAGRLGSVGACTALAGYTIDIWQADENGDYHDASEDFRLRGRVTTDPEGRFAFETIMPGRYATAAGLRPAHLHVRAYSPGGLTLVTTQLYFAGDPFLGTEDGCQPPTCFSGDLARTLSLRPATMEGRAGMAGEVELFVPIG
ncbi:MAG: hypothetical protein AB8I08_09945 [Sandaracinaceae bacterium]